MKSKSLIVLLVSGLFALQFAALSSAQSDAGEVIAPWFGVETPLYKGGEFEVRFSIIANETGDFTIKLEPRDEFWWISNENYPGSEKTITINSTGDSRTFIFKGENNVKLENGTYLIMWTAYLNGTEFESGSLDVRAGEQVPGFGVFTVVVLATVAVGLSRRIKL